MTHHQSKQTGTPLPTLAGILAVLIWSTTIAFSKSVMQTEGTNNAIFMIYFFSGIIMLGILLLWLRKDFFLKWKKLSYRYYIKIGIFLLLNNTLLFLAIGFTSNEDELLIVTIINYLWPIITYIIKVPMFRLKPKKVMFLSSIVLAFMGVILAFSQSYSLDGLIHSVLRSPFSGLRSPFSGLIAYLLTFLTAVSWAFYSNLTKKYHTDDDVAALPLIFALSGLLFLLVQLYKGSFEFSHLTSLYHNYELIYMILFPTTLAYLFWYIAMKKGNKDLVVSFSFLIPLLSIFVLSLKFSKRIGTFVWIAAFLLILGAYLSYRATPEIPKEETKH